MATDMFVEGGRERREFGGEGREVVKWRVSAGVDEDRIVEAEEMVMDMQGHLVFRVGGQVKVVYGAGYWREVVKVG